MKRRELVRSIEEMGCQLIRHGGKHDWYQNPRTRVAQRRNQRISCEIYPEEAFMTAEPAWQPAQSGRPS